MIYCQKCGNELPEGAKYCPVCGTAVTMEEAPTATSMPTAPVAAEVSGLKLAFWGEHFVAWLIDAVIVGVVVGILGLFVSLSWWSGWPSWIPFFNFNGVFLFLYWLFMDGSYGQSFGKMVMRIKVTRLDGSQIGMGNAALESLGKGFLASAGLPVRLDSLPEKETANFQLHLRNNSNKRNMKTSNQPCFLNIFLCLRTKALYEPFLASLPLV